MTKIYRMGYLTMGMILSSFISGCSREDADSYRTQSEILKDLETTRAQYEENRMISEDTLTSCLSDGFLSITEQERIYSSLKRLEDLAREYNAQAENLVERTDSLELSPEYRELLRLTDKNLNGFDYGTPNIQEELSKRGHCEVESVESPPEIVVELSAEFALEITEAILENQ